MGISLGEHASRIKPTVEGVSELLAITAVDTEVTGTVSWNGMALQLSLLETQSLGPYLPSLGLYTPSVTSYWWWVAQWETLT